jgi:aspartyl-tRNA(Asn)/glutamyl-tRNA(Gln) amidotransferase subunit A
MSIPSLSATELVQELRQGHVTAVQATEACLDVIDDNDADVGAFLHVDAAGARQAAEQIDRRRAAGEPLGALAGVPIAVKDVLCTKDQPTTCGSQALARFQPPYDATLIARLRAAGAVLIGKTNMDEFAMGSSTENSGFQVTRNPWDLSRVPGGSSGGSAASVAARQVPWAIGTDTGGSVRQPAAFCGVVGLKPTYGRVSRFGLVAYASSLDQAGPFGRTAADVALLLEAIAGHDPQDSTSAAQPVPPYSQRVAQPLKPLTIGVIRDHFGEGLHEDVEHSVQQAIRDFQSLGAKIVDVRLPHGKYGIAAYYVIAPCEASSNLARYDGVHYGHRTDEAVMQAELASERVAGAGGNAESPLVRMYRRSRTEAFGLEVKRRIMLGTFALSAGYQDRYYLKAQQARRLIRNDYDQAFQQADLLLGPTAPTAAYRLGEKLLDPLSMYLGDLYTVGANLAGIAALSLPCGFTRQGLPIGLQLQGPPFSEENLLRAAHMYQMATDWHARRPSSS